MNLQDAITAVEQAQANFNATKGKTDADQAIVDAAQQKLDAAKATVADDAVAQRSAAIAFNSSLDDLVTAINASKIPVPEAPVA